MSSCVRNHSDSPIITSLASLSSASRSLSLSLRWKSPHGLLISQLSADERGTGVGRRHSRSPRGLYLQR